MIIGSLIRGISVFCDFNFGEEVLIGEVDFFIKIYIYRKLGIFIVSFNCLNRVSSMYKEFLKRIIV